MGFLQVFAWAILVPSKAVSASDKQRKGVIEKRIRYPTPKVRVGERKCRAVIYPQESHLLIS